jgi:hypothetical protein
VSVSDYLLMKKSERSPFIDRGVSIPGSSGSAGSGSDSGSDSILRASRVALDVLGSFWGVRASRRLLWLLADFGWVLWIQIVRSNLSHLGDFQVLSLGALAR